VTIPSLQYGYSPFSRPYRALARRLLKRVQFFRRPQGALAARRRIYINEVTD
jgi:hypothetical protein